MMKLACKEVDPSSTCPFVAMGASASEVAGKMVAHIKTDHPEAMKGSDVDMVNSLEVKVHE